MTEHFLIRGGAASARPEGIAAGGGVFATSNPEIEAPAIVPAPAPGWCDLPALNLSARRLSRHRIVAASRMDSTHVTIDILRTRLMGLMRENGWKTLGVTSPRGGCGKTTLALNLAFSFAQQADFRVGLVDLDLRRPNVARLLNLERPGPLEGFLRGRRTMAESLHRHRTNLVVAPNDTPVADAAELLGECIPGQAIPMMRRALKLDLVIYDLPPMLAADDALVMLPAVDAMVLVVAAGETTMSEIQACERDLSHPGKLAGIVLNKCRYLPEPYGY